MKLNQNTSHKVKLILQASNLRNKSIIAAAFRPKPSPFAVVTKLGRHRRNQQSKEEPCIVGKTESIANTLQPQWTKYFLLDFEFGKELFVEISIYDDDDKELLAFTRMEVGSILGKRQNHSVKRMQPQGSLYAQVLPYETPKTFGKIQFVLEVGPLKNNTNTYYEVHRKDNFETGALWVPIVRSDVITLTNEDGFVSWETCSILFSEIAANNDMDVNDCPIRIRFWQQRKIKKHKVLGSLETTITGMMESFKNENFMRLTKDQDRIEEIAKVTSIDISEDNENYEDGEHANLGYEISSKSLPVPGSLTTKDLSNIKLVPSFVEYITAGCELDLAVAIDFTSSNGNPLTPGTPHFIDNDSLNEYEKAIIGIGSIVTKYDSDQKSQVWGFGAKYEGIVRHCFQVGDHSHVRGVQGILEAYRNTFQRGLRMSSPVLYTEVIRTASKAAKKKLEKAAMEGKQSYSILLILTHGCVGDIDATKAILKEVSDTPLSIIFVGIGQNDFSAMKFLDDFQLEEGGRDICNFVKFDPTKDRTKFTTETLNEIPDQLVSYFVARGILPSKEEEEEFDIIIDESDTNAESQVIHRFDSEIMQVSEKKLRYDSSKEYQY